MTHYDFLTGKLVETALTGHDILYIDVNRKVAERSSLQFAPHWNALYIPDDKPGYVRKFHKYPLYLQPDCPGYRIVCKNPIPHQPMIIFSGEFPEECRR